MKYQKEHLSDKFKVTAQLRMARRLGELDEVPMSLILRQMEAIRRSAFYSEERVEFHIGFLIFHITRN